MDGILSLLRPVLESNSKDETLRTFLLSCADQRAFSKDPSGIPSLIASINAKLNEPPSRHEGLLLLQAFLPQCTDDVVCSNAHSWMQFCLKGIPVPNTSQLSFTVLRILLSLSTKFPELTKNVSSIVVPNFFEQIHKKILPQSYLVALECLEQCMDMYSGPCGPHKKVIEKLLLSIIDFAGQHQYEVWWQAARCMALLPQVGGGGTGGSLHKCAWAAQHKSLCRTMHIILDALYADKIEIQVSLVDGTLEGTEPLPLTPLDDDDPILLAQKLTARLLAVSAYLQAMLVVRFPVPKTISLSSILNLVCRGLAVHGNSTGYTTTQSLALAAEIPKIHYSLLKLLESLIVVCRTNLLPFAGLICKLVVQTLKWTRVDNWPYGSDKPYSFLRIQAYAVATLWCGTAKFGSLMEEVAEHFVELALPDIHSERGSVLLSAKLSKKNKYANQKQLKRKSNTSQEHRNESLTSHESLASSSVLNVKANDKVCVSALQALRALIIAASFKMQPSSHKTLQETVVATLLQISSLNQESVIPYSESAPRLELYRLLLQLVLDNHPVLPGPTNIATKLFAKGLNDSDAEVSIFCSVAQSAVSKIIHPAHATLQIPISYYETEKALGEQRKLPSLLPPHASDNGTYEDNNDLKSSDSESESLSNGRSSSLVPNKGRERSIVVIPPTPQNNALSASKYLLQRKEVFSESDASPLNANSKSPSSKGAEKKNNVNHFAATHSPGKSKKGSLNDDSLTQDQLDSTQSPLKSDGPSSDKKRKTEENDIEKKRRNEEDPVEKKRKTEVEPAEETRNKELKTLSKSGVTVEEVDLGTQEAAEANISMASNVTFDEEMIDLAQSDKSDEICEVDIADSEDDDSISICSQSTINSPHASKENNTSKAVKQVQDKKASPEKQPIVDTTLMKSEPHSSPMKDVGNGSPLLSREAKENEKSSPVKAPEPQVSPPTSTSPRVLRSRTISNSSCSPTKKSVTLEPVAVEEEDSSVYNPTKPVEEDDIDDELFVGAALRSSFIDMTQEGGWR